MTYDAIVVGARCAGSPTAMLLARQGYRVLLVDRASLPADIRLSTHLVWQAGGERLARWGLLDAVRASGCPPLPTVTLDLGPITLRGTPASRRGVTEAFAPRRRVLDEILLDAAVAAGAEVRDQCTVEELTRDADRVTGVRGRAGSAPFSESATLVIGADGVRSRVARLVDAAQYDAQPVLEGTYFSYWSDVPVDGVEIAIRDGRAVYAWATNDHLSLVGVNWAIADYGDVRGSPEDNFREVVETVAPDLAGRLGHGARVDNWIGSTTAGFYRKPFGPGWALVGDAGYNKDPGTAQGISDAFRDAELLADAVHLGFSGRRPLEDALADYESERNAASGPMYAFTNQLASFAPMDPMMQQLFGALAGNPEQTDRFFGVMAGTVPVPEFFAPDNVGAILGAAI